MDNDNKQHGGDFYALVAWADANRKQLMWTVGLVVAAGLLAGVYFLHKQGREESANAAFCALKLPHSERNVLTSADADQFVQVANNYPGTSGAARALLVAGGIYYELGQFPQAQQTFERMLAENGDYPLASKAALGVAASLEAQGKTSEAAAHYEELVRGSADANWPQAKSALARIYTEENHPDRAFQLYREMLQANSGDSWTMEARVQATELLEKYPALREQLAAQAQAQQAQAPAQQGQGQAGASGFQSVKP